MKQSFERMCCYIPDQDKLDIGCDKLAVYRILFGYYSTVDDFTETCADHLEVMPDDNVRFEVLRIPEAA